MLRAFAAQAAAAVRNVHLVRALEARRLELARKVEQLQALSEVGETVSSTLVLDEVLFKIILNAVRFAECDGGSIMEYVEADRCFLARTTYPEQPGPAGRAAPPRDRAGRDPGRDGRPRRGGRSGYPTSRWSSGTSICSSCSRTAGGLSSPFRCCAAARSSASWWSGGRPRASSPTRSRSSWRRSPASPRWRYSTLGCFASSSARAPSCRWPASTSRTFWPACRTS